MGTPQKGYGDYKNRSGGGVGWDNANHIVISRRCYLTHRAFINPFESLDRDQLALCNIITSYHGRSGLIKDHEFLVDHSS